MNERGRRWQHGWRAFLFVVSAATVLPGCGTSEVSVELLRFAEDLVRQVAAALLF